MFKFVAMILAITVLSYVSAVESTPEQLESTTALENVKANDKPEDVYRIFNRFCKAHFGAQHEPLVRETFGKNLQILEDGTWVYASQHSAMIAFESNLPAYTSVSYASAEVLDKITPQRERAFYIHIHHLKNLQANTKYHWQAQLTDEFGNTINSKKLSFKTLGEKDLIPFPQVDEKPPYVIDKPGKYVLKQDINAARTAIKIKTSNVHLDLGGHTIVYGNEKAADGHFKDKWMSYVHDGFFGIQCIDQTDITIVNGIVKQGVGDNRGNNESTGFNPLYLRSLSGVELAGLEVDYHTPQITGIRNRGATGDYHIHHNLIRDRGTKMHNRHGSGCAAVDFLAGKESKPIYHHNLIARTRQNGFRGSPIECYNNEVYVDSWATNSFATAIGEGRTMHHNRIFGTGYHAIACPWGNGIKVKNNFFHMQGINTGKTRWWEGFGDQNSMNGLRHTQWGNNKRESKNSLYENNVVCIYGRNGSQIRGVEFFSDTYIEGLTLKDSIIKIISQDEKTTKAACVVTHGNPKREDTQKPVYYINNTFISNASIIRIGDDYGKGSHHHFFNNRFVRIGERASFHTFVAMGTYTSRFHRFVDSVFGDGTAADDVDWTSTGAGSRNYDIEWTLHISSRAGSAVTIVDATGAKVFTGKIDDNGNLKIPLKQYRMSKDQQTLYTPHQITVNGITKTLSIDKQQTINF